MITLKNIYSFSLVTALGLSSTSTNCEKTKTNDFETYCKWEDSKKYMEITNEQRTIKWKIHILQEKLKILKATPEEANEILAHAELKIKYYQHELKTNQAQLKKLEVLLTKAEQKSETFKLQRNKASHSFLPGIVINIDKIERKIKFLKEELELTARAEKNLQEYLERETKELLKLQQEFDAQSKLTPEKLGQKIKLEELELSHLLSQLKRYDEELESLA